MRYNIFWKEVFKIKNKAYALKLVEEKQNGVNNYSYSQISILTGYTKMQVIRFSKLIITFLKFVL